MSPLRPLVRAGLCVAQRANAEPDTRWSATDNCPAWPLEPAPASAPVDKLCDSHRRPAEANRCRSAVQQRAESVANHANDTFSAEQRRGSSSYLIGQAECKLECRRSILESESRDSKSAIRNEQWAIRDSQFAIRDRHFLMGRHVSAARQPVALGQAGQVSAGSVQRGSLRDSSVGRPGSVGSEPDGNPEFRIHSAATATPHSRVAPKPSCWPRAPGAQVAERADNETPIVNSCSSAARPSPSPDRPITHGRARSH